MIKIIDGDLLNSNTDIIAHQTNCSSAMNSGAAKQIREKYPEVFRAYKQACDFEALTNTQKNLLGFCQLVKCTDGKYVANLFGQLGYGYDGKQYTDIDALKNAMIQLRDKMTKNQTVAMPYKIGCARGGANWDDVYKIIEEVFEDYNVELWRWDRG